MGRYTDIFNKLYDKLQDEVTRNEFFNTMEKHMARLEKSNPEGYKHVMEQMETISCAISADDARIIVSKMYPRGQKWSLEEVKNILASKNIVGKDVKYYLAINMVYNDYYDTASAFGLQRDPEFFFMLAKDFVEDPDAKPMKVEKYFKE